MANVQQVLSTAELNAKLAENKAREWASDVGTAASISANNIRQAASDAGVKSNDFVQGAAPTIMDNIRKYWLVLPAVLILLVAGWYFWWGPTF